MDEIVCGLVPMQIHRFCKMSCVATSSFRNDCNRKTLRIRKEESYSVRLSWSVSRGSIMSELSLENHPSLDSGIVIELFQTITSYNIKVLLDQVTKTMVQESKHYASHEALLALSLNGYIPCKSSKFETLR